MRLPFLRKLLLTTRDALLPVLLLLLLLTTEKREGEVEVAAVVVVVVIDIVAQIGLAFGAGIAALSKLFTPIADEGIIENAMKVAPRTYFQC